MTSKLERNDQDDRIGQDIAPEFKISSYEFDLPPELIAQEPARIRDESRLMVIDRSDSSIKHHLFRDLPTLLNISDVLVVNETSVIPGLIKGFKTTGGSVELLVLNPGPNMEIESESGEAIRECLVKTSKQLKTGSSIFLNDQISLTVEKPLRPGRALIRFPCADNKFLDFLEYYGQTPLPPYIKPRADSNVEHKSRYQTIYSRKPGSVAAPTAGLHFTDELLRRLQEIGIIIVRITLHVGIGTFMPMRTHDIRLHKMETEVFEISEHSAKSINSAVRAGQRIIAVGSTSARTLESAAIDDKTIMHGSQSTDLFITPGYNFKIVGAMITNFHLPHSTLLALVSAFSSISMIRKSYNEAIKYRYRFFSYGDSSIII